MTMISNLLQVNFLFKHCNIVITVSIKLIITIWNEQINNTGKTTKLKHRFYKNETKALSNLNYFIKDC